MVLNHIVCVPKSVINHEGHEEHEAKKMKIKNGYTYFVQNIT